VVVKSKNNIFGGYSDIKIKSVHDGPSRNNGSSFIYKLLRKNNFIKLKYDGITGEIYHNRYKILSFGM